MLIFRDGSGAVPLVLRKKRFENTQLWKNIDEGYEVKIVGFLQLCDEEYQVWPRDEADIQVFSTPTKAE